MNALSPSALRLDDQLCFALYAASNAVVRAYRPLLHDLGLTYPQYLVMLVMWQDGPSSAGRVATRLQLDSHAVTPLVTGLVEAGLVERRHGADRRRVEVVLTPRGRELENDASRAQVEVVRATGLGPLQLARLRGELTRLSDRLDALEPDDDHASTPTEGEPR